MLSMVIRKPCPDVAVTRHIIADGLRDGEWLSWAHFAPSVLASTTTTAKLADGDRGRMEAVGGG
jgi:hypothetical protein